MNKLLSLLLTLAVLSFSPVAVAYWDEAWAARVKITVNPQSASVAVDQVPVAIRLHSGNFNFVDASADGADLRFVAADDKTELKFHIEKFDSVNELAVVWVLLPRIDPADKTAHFWLYYGNEEATAAADSKDGWDPSTMAVFHFNENSPLRDSSRNALAARGEIAAQKAGLLGEAGIFTGKPIVIAPSPALKLNTGSGFSYSAWIKPGTVPQHAVLYSQGPLSIKIDERKLVLASGETTISGGEIKGAGWQHVAATAGAGKSTLYVNGAPVGTGRLALSDAQAEVKIGEGYSGELDEIQIANVTRSEDWVKLAATGQGMDSQLLKVGKPSTDGEENGEDSVSYFGILFQSLTIDAWVVIVILSIMFAISVTVMALKGKLINRTDRGNRLFLERFGNAAHDDLLVLDKDANYPDSTVFHLYGAGLREIRKRYTNGNELALSGASLDAIKASIDANLIRENKKLNANMVLLTIAISGGPFLGLLGTVIGVMITFAAIAAAGDVNVNAIAPGIAAALLATVAGLGVAIPALFGYNYLASRIKNITTDMQIFVDEFVTRVAELYGR
jgi:biopolymer transport protein ExbB